MQVLCITVFAVAGATMFYALFGYPLLLGWMAGRANNPVHKDDKLRTVSFVIAVYNGEKFLERKLNTILNLNYPRELMEILVVSDGSIDRTDEIARSFAPQGVRFLRVPHGGKAAALNAGVPQVSGEILALCDVRQTLEPEIETRPLFGGNAAAVEVADALNVKHLEAVTDLEGLLEYAVVPNFKALAPRVRSRMPLVCSDVLQSSLSSKRLSMGRSSTS